MFGDGQSHEIGAGLSGQQPTLPPFLDEIPEFQDDGYPQQKGRNFNEVVQLRDDKLFQRLEEWLQKLEAVMIRPVSPHNKSVESWMSEDHAEEKAHRASVVVRELEDSGKRTSVNSKTARKEDLKTLVNDHRELRVALGQTEGADREHPSLRQRLLRFIGKKLNFWNEPDEGQDAAYEVKEVELTKFQRFMDKLVNAWMFEAFFALVIMTNSVVIAVQVEELAKDPGAPTSEVSFFVNSIYTFLFTLELVLRIIARGLSMFCGPEWAWYILDVVVVSSSLFEFVLELALHQSGENTTNVFTNMRLLRILRIGRITRAIRVVRLVKFIRSLRALLYQIGNTLRVMVWSVVLLALIIFLFGLIFTDIASEYLARDPSEISQVRADFLALRFGGLEPSMHTLYASITGGLTWIEAVDCFSGISTIWGLLFEAYIAFCMFAVLNVMTGVFCQSAMESAEKDHELILQNVVQEKAKYFRAVRRLFAQLDKNADGGITHQEFEAAINDPSLRAVFDALEINAADAWALFQQLDSDGNNHVDVEEFLEGCMILKGPARSIDVVCIKRDMAAVRSRFDQQVNDIKSLQRMLHSFERPGGGHSKAGKSKDGFLK